MNNKNYFVPVRLAGRWAAPYRPNQWIIVPLQIARIIIRRGWGWNVNLKSQ